MDYYKEITVMTIYLGYNGHSETYNVNFTAWISKSSSKFLHDWWLDLFLCRKLEKPLKFVKVGFLNIVFYTIRHRMKFVYEKIASMALFVMKTSIWIDTHASILLVLMCTCHDIDRLHTYPFYIIGLCHNISWKHDTYLDEVTCTLYRWWSLLSPINS